MRIQVEPSMTEAEAATLAGTLLDDSAYDRVVREDCEVVRPDGTPLVVFRRNVLAAGDCAAAYPALRHAAYKTDNRGVSTGVIKSEEVTRSRRLIGTKSQVSLQYVKRDGTLDRVIRAKDSVESGLIGYYERTSRQPFCRLTAFNLDRPRQFADATPFIRAVDRAFARELPDRYAAQRAVIARTHPDFYIRGTAFTTITVNRNWQTAVHQDRGDLKAGFGVMSVLQAGRYSGGLLAFPRWRVAVDMRSRDVCLADVHEWHGNTPIVGRPGGYERISCVFYYREKMQVCGSAAEELERAKARVPGKGMPLHA